MKRNILCNTQMNMEWLEIPWLREDLVFPAGVPMPEMVNGEVLLPPGPGLGIPV